MTYMDRRKHELSATTSAVSWTIYEAGDFDIRLIAIKFDSAPTTSENVTLTLDSSLGAAYDTVLRVVDPSATSSTDIVFEDLELFANGDKLLVTYTNTDGNGWLLYLCGFYNHFTPRRGYSFWRGKHQRVC